MARTVWFLTGNAGKLKEATTPLGTVGLYWSSQLVVDSGVSIVEPQADTLEEVAQVEKIAQALCASSRR